jgi:hypothetical protein
MSRTGTMVVVVGTWLWLACAGPGIGNALAQTSAVAPGPPRVEIAGLALFVGGGQVGDSRATLVGNQIPAGAPFELFRTNARIASAPAGEVRVAVRVAGDVFAEGGVSYARPELQVRISGDVEGVPGVVAVSALTQAVFDGALQYRFGRGRVVPFVLAGAGVLRQLDEPRTTLELGQVIFAGGGLRYGLGRPRAGGGHRFALRGDVRLVGYRGGLLGDDDNRPVGVVAGGGIAIGL